MRPLRLGPLACAGLVAGILAAPAIAQTPAPIEPVAVIDAQAGPVDPSTLSGYIAYSGRAGGGFSLVVRDPTGQVRTLPYRQGVAFGADLGTDRGGAVVLTFTRCAKAFKGTCDAWVWPLQAGGAPRRVKETPTVGRQDTVSMWKGVVTWSEIGRGGRAEVFQNRPGASVKRAKRLWRSTTPRTQRVQRLDSSATAQAWTLTTDVGNDRDAAELYVRASGRVTRRVRLVSAAETSVDVQGVQIAAGRVYWVQATGRFSAGSRTATAYRMTTSGAGRQSHMVPDDTIAVAPDAITGADRVLLSEYDLLFTGDRRERQLRLVDLTAWR